MIIPTLTRAEAIQNIISSSKPSLVSIGYGGDLDSLGEKLRHDITDVCGHCDVHFVKAKWRHGVSLDSRWRRVDLLSSFGRIVFGVCNDRAAAYSWSSNGLFNGLIISHSSREQLNAIDQTIKLRQHEYKAEKDPAKKREIAERHMLASFDINTLVMEANHLAREIDAQAEAIRLLYLTDPEAAKTAFKALEDQYGDILGTLESRVFK
ncbi:hypothetical protein AS299_15020 [Citrobacter freundii]|nr:hypothetical protein AS299_15020 [Citrobacter freundii]